MDIIRTDGINILEKIKAVLKGGHIALIYRECDSIFGEKILKELVRDYRITKKIFPSRVENDESVVEDIMDLEDDVRMLFVLGGENIIECAKVASTMLGISLVIMLTTPTRIDANTALIHGNKGIRRRVQSPMLIMYDGDYLMKKGGFQSVISTMGEIVLNSIDRLYADVIEGRGIDRIEGYKNLLERVKNIDRTKPLELLETVYREDYNGSVSSYIGDAISRKMPSYMEKCNIKFVTTYTILMLYHGYIRRSGDDLLFPPDIGRSAELIEKEYGIEMSRSIDEYKMMSSYEYMRAMHLETEYREELIDIISEARETMSYLAKAFRRLSRDAGYNMYEDITLDEIMKSISLSSIFVKESTPQRMMKAGGYLERYII